VSPYKFTFVQVIKACAGLATLEDRRLVHKHLIQSGCESDVFVGSSLVDMYTKYGSIEEARKVFNKMDVETFHFVTRTMASLWILGSGLVGYCVPQVANQVGETIILG